MKQPVRRKRDLRWELRAAKRRQRKLLRICQALAAEVRALRAERFRLSPNLTLYPTEFSKVRLQYNYDHRDGIGSDHSLWLQFEFILGAHAAHKF